MLDNRVSKETLREEFMHTLRRYALGAITAWAITGLATGAADAQTPFYAGKQLSMIINFGAGSSTDIEARLFGRHIAKHIDGHPTIVMQNKPGAGGLLGGLYLGEVANKDGTSFGFLTALGWAYASRSQDFRVDLKTYEFIGFSSGAAIYFIRSDVAPGIKTAADIGKVQRFVSGGVNSRSGRDATIRMTLDMLGVPYKHVSGYRSGEKAMLALQRQEIHFYSTTPPLYRNQILPNLVSKGVVTPLYVDPSWDGKKLSVSKQVADLPILPFQELYQKVKGRAPSGQLWDAYLACLRLNGGLQRLIALPPGAPKAALDALRFAVRRLNSDPAYAADAKKTLGYVPDYHSDADTNEQVRSALTVTQQIRAFVANYIKDPKKK